MTCRRAFDADLAAVLHGESADTDFLAHYPTCPACATEVGVWRELDALLRTRTPNDDVAHPEPETLVAFADATLAGAARADVERHVATCRVCADELRALGGFDPARLAAPAPAPARQPARGALARVVWHPAFAYALVALLLVPIVLERWPQMETRVAEERAPAQSQTERLAEHDVAARPAPAPPPAPPAKPPALEPPRTERAREQELAKQAGPADAELAGAHERRDGIAALGRRLEAPASRDAGGAPGAARNESARALADAAAPTRVLVLDPKTPAVLAAPARDEGVRLRIAAPRGLAAGPVDVTVRARARGSELHVRADRADAIAIDIPPNWLVPGDYVVELRSVAGAPARGAPVTIAFTVAAASAESEP